MNLTQLFHLNPRRPFEKGWSVITDQPFILHFQSLGNGFEEKINILPSKPSSSLLRGGKRESRDWVNHTFENNWRWGSSKYCSHVQLNLFAVKPVSTNALYKLTKSEPIDGNEPRGCVDQLTLAVHKNEPIPADNKCQFSLCSLLIGS